MRKPWVGWVVGVPLAIVVLAGAGTWAYINLLREDAPDRLTVDASGDEPAGASPSTSASTGAGAATGGVEGVWKVAAGSQAGYRVDEILFGQRAVAVGRTEEVTGQLAIEGTKVTSGRFTVDMASVTSDQSRRDNQFRGRIMDVATHPTSTFELTSPISVDSLPADGVEVTAKATGDLTLRGTTRKVTFDVTAKRSGATIRVAGSIPIVFAEWNIPNPSFGPAETGDDGELEFLLVLAR